jgi:hypothetical protein
MAGLMVFRGTRLTFRASNATMVDMRRAALLVYAGVLLLTSCSSGSKSSVVTGYIEPCVGAGPYTPNYAAGTVTALRGTERLVRITADEIKVVLPTEVVARTHVDENKPFNFRLAAGEYVLVGAYDQFPTTTTRLSVTVPPTTTLRRNLPNLCK